MKPDQSDIVDQTQRAWDRAPEFDPGSSVAGGNVTTTDVEEIVQTAKFVEHVSEVAEIMNISRMYTTLDSFRQELTGPYVFFLLNALYSIGIDEARNYPWWR